MLLMLPQTTSSAPAPKPHPNPEPAPFTPGLKIGALAGAALVIKGTRLHHTQIQSKLMLKLN